MPLYLAQLRAGDAGYLANIGGFINDEDNRKKGVGGEEVQCCRG